MHPRRLLLPLLWLCLGAAVSAQVQIHGIASLPVTPVTYGQSVQLSADASASAPGALEYRWDFGDGTPRTEWLPSASVDHVFASPGSFVVLVQVRHATLGLASATAPMTVRLAAAPQARGSTSILVHGARREVWVANPDHDSVGVLDADLLVPLAEIAVNATPSALALDAAGNVWVNAQDDDTLQRIDAATRTITATLELGYGARPVALVFDAGGQGYVALAGAGAVRRFVAATGQITGELALGAGPEAMILRGDGSALFVSRLVSGQGEGTLWRIALPAFAAAEPIALPLDVSSPDSGTAARGVPNYVATLALAEDGESLWYGGKKDNVLRGLFREGQPLTFESSLRSLLGRVDATTGSERVDRRMDLDDAGRVSAVLLAPGSSHLFAAQETNHRVLVLDPWNRAELARVDTGFAPRGLAFDAVTRRLFVQAFLSRRVDVFDVGAQLDDGVGEVTTLGSVVSAAGEPLSAVVLQGKRVFHDSADARMTQDGYFSCAACHLDGRNDGRVWDFTQLGEGLRNTTSLRGAAGMGHGLVHWSGNFDEIQDFEVPIRNLFGGTGFMLDEDYFSDGRAAPLGAPKAGFSAELDALAAYVATLDRHDRSPHRASDGSLSADGAAGRVLFEQLACHRCHAGAGFTDSGSGVRHDIGTLSSGSGTRLGGPLLALDTPSLRGVFGAAPYLHDGRAATLEAVFDTHNPDGRHGDTAALSTLQFEQLLSFLRQIDDAEPGMPPPPTLGLTSPLPGAQVTTGASLALAVATDLPAITRVDYRIDGAVVATALAPPWQADWNAIGVGPDSVVQADVQHDGGRFRTLSAAVPIRGNDVPGRLFAHGFEP